MDEGLDVGAVEMSYVGGGLAGFLAQHHGLGTNAAEGVDDYFSSNGLNGVDDHGHCSGV